MIPLPLLLLLPLQRYQTLSESELRETDETVSAIDEYLERAQDAVGINGSTGILAAASERGTGSAPATVPSVVTPGGAGADATVDTAAVADDEEIQDVQGHDNAGHDDQEVKEVRQSRGAWVKSKRWSRRAQ